MALERHLPPDCRFSVPEGGNMLWVQMPAGTDSIKIYQEALQAGVSIVPGQAFSVANRYKEYIRISCTTPFDNKIDQAVKTLCRIIAGCNRNRGHHTFPNFMIRKAIGTAK
jgi:DNA-binding transcriptional MocR family regulator